MDYSGIVSMLEAFKMYNIAQSLSHSFYMALRTIHNPEMDKVNVKMYNCFAIWYEEHNTYRFWYPQES